MGGEAAGSAEPGSEGATVHVRCSNGTKFSVTVSLGTSVLAFKHLLVERSDVPAEQQRLIYKGRVLKDDNSLESYGLQSDHTVHLVRGAPAASGAPPAPPSAAPAATPAAPGTANVAQPGGMGGLLSTGMPEFQQVQQQLMQNPNLMRDMMSMPAVQSLMNNPELMRSLIMSNPQMRDIMDRNPDLAHILNDPATLRQTLDAARNPELMREMMRNTDRAMSNIEASPEGFNMLRRMYETVQEPLLNAATMGGADANATAPAAPANPFAALLARPAATANQQQGTATPADGATVFPNTAPLPNPWNPTARTTAGDGAAPGPAAAPPTSAALPLNLTGLGGLGGLGAGGGLGLGGLGDTGGLGLEQVMQNPAFMQAMQSLLSNPQYINQLLNMHPQLRNMLNTNPQFRDMMQNPDFLRQLSSPESLQQMLTLQQTLLSQLGRQQPSQDQGANNNNANAAGPDLSALLTMFGGLASSPEVNTLPPEQLYATQLSQLQDMGFFDTQENIRALTATGGNVHAAVERLLGNPT